MTFLSGNYYGGGWTRRWSDRGSSARPVGSAGQAGEVRAGPWAAPVWPASFGPAKYFPENLDFPLTVWPH